ncbi:MAG: hypothetical protein HRU24_07295 [Gammaproteobacteria bacterium]|nr:hypothetical protein [Gammaproteobacteria bacterium]
MVDNSQKLKILICQADKYFKANEFNAALKLFDEIVHLNPEEHVNNFKLACCHYQLKNYGLATEIFNHLTKINSQDYQTWYFLGQSLSAQHQKQQAQEAFNVAQKIDTARFSRDQAPATSLAKPINQSRQRSKILNRRLQVMATIITIIIGGIGIYQASQPNKVIDPVIRVPPKRMSTIFYKVVGGPFVMLGEAPNQLKAAAGKYWLKIDVRFSSHCHKPFYVEPNKFTLKVTRISKRNKAKLIAQAKVKTQTKNKARTKPSTLLVKGYYYAAVQPNSGPKATGSKTFRGRSKGSEKLKKALPSGFIEQGEVREGTVLFQVSRAFVGDSLYKLQLKYSMSRRCQLTLTRS